MPFPPISSSLPKSPPKPNRSHMQSADTDNLSPTTPAPALHVDVNFPGEFKLLDPTTPGENPSGASMAPSQSYEAALKQEAHSQRLNIRLKTREGKGTDKAYLRHVKSYEKFIKEHQDIVVKEDPTHQRLEAHPITGMKVSLFLHSEINRNKRNSKGETKIGTSVGKEHIKQTISALQRYIHDHQHDLLYENEPETRISLRNQEWIKAYEDYAKKDTHGRHANAHILKSTGTSSDTYTQEELVRMANWAMAACGPSDIQTFLGSRDRAMLLLSISIAFRGDSTRQLLWSDLFWKDQPMPTIHDKASIEALVAIADQAKTNTTGRVDEHGLFRHRNVELCAFGGLGFLAFMEYQVMRKDVPHFAPDFADPKHGEYGKRSWYDLCVFPSVKGGAQPEGTKPMTYENHRNRLLNIHQKNNVLISHVTHGGRFYSAYNASNYGASGLDIKTLGNWKTGDAYSEIYNRALPTSAMLASATFNAQRPETYNLPRAILEPPESLLAALFPWVEGEQAAYYGRLQKYGDKATDRALDQFLKLLIKFRRIILQDAAQLFRIYPEWPLWKHHPFNTDEFSNFAHASVAIIEAAEITARHKLKNMPEVIAESFAGILQGMDIQRRQDLQAANAQNEYLQGMILSRLSGRKKPRLSETPPESLAPSRSASVARPSPITYSVKPGITTVNDQSSPAMLSHNIDPVIDPVLQTISQAPVVVDQPRSEWPSDLFGVASSFALSKNQDLRGIQLLAIRELIKKYGQDKVKAHQFEWSFSNKRSIPDEWLPIYRYNIDVKTIREIWTEHADGINGCLSVRQLVEGWGARWRRNVDGQKTEATRRNVLVKLITSLSEKKNWTVQLALEYLEDQYPMPSATTHLKNPRAFINYLQDKNNGIQRRQEVLDNSLKYTK